MKKQAGYLRSLMITLLVLCNIGCDQVSKNIVRQEIGYNENIKFISNRFTLTKVENTGAFLSLGNALPQFIKFTFLSLLPAILLLYGIYYLITKKGISKIFIIGACFVIGGGLGNLYDRMRYGSVTDFLHIDFGIFKTGIFNLADVSVMIGILIILIRTQTSAFKTNPATHDNTI